ncbi:hypothetical protein FA15DRAFT_662759 [Coprinopsis marcescibilis]|uniref:F-box domain-containing protein n=1 Tax=Coprinopsis marcescibilis TaxID=230819 RepID=A0A5C3LD15_COPMA|nr:hypothetical protein FA15DRAFT_662759 [Coprinopsis marcescibilis]
MADPVSDLPIEVLHRILVLCHPLDVISFSRTSRAASKFIWDPEDQHLWRQLYLAYPLDDPEVVLKERQAAKLPSSPPGSSDQPARDWRTPLLEVVKAERFLQRYINDTPDEQEDYRASLKTFMNILRGLRVARLPDQIAAQHVQPSYNGQWLERILPDSKLLAQDPDSTNREFAGALSRLRISIVCYIDTNHEAEIDDEALEARRTQSRSFVYDLRNYTARTRWGPFLPGMGHRVNWVHIEHLMTVLWMNLNEVPASNVPLPPRGIEAMRAYSALGSFTENDWAGVEGTWCRCVCFMDYNDLFALNFPDEGPVPALSVFTDPGFHEAVRLMEVKLQLVSSELYASFRTRAPALPSTDEVCDTHKTLFFTGESRGIGGVNSSIRGLVYMDKEGVVKWRLMSLYNGTTQWSSTGVQLGDVGSAAGVIGVWTSVLHEPRDPAGPFRFWKNEDNAVVVMDYA